MTRIIVIIAVALLVGVYISWRAGRLDRMHTRLDTARAALDAALLRRSSVALELASSGLLDPATSLLVAGAAHAPRSGAPGHKALPASALPRTLRAAFAQPHFRASLAGRAGAAELLAETEAAAHQVFLARRFYNSAVTATRTARRRWLVRLFRLAGSAGPPQFFEIDDSLVAPGTDEAAPPGVSRLAG